MKKSLRKLNLCRETLHALESPALGKVAGGVVVLTAPLNCQSGPSYCCSFPPVCGGTIEP